MNSHTFLAFGKELGKQVFFEKLSLSLLGALKEGWHGTPEQISRGQGQSWLGKGPNMRVRPQADGSVKALSRMGRLGERASSLGGLTKALPVGGKAMTVLPTLMMARGALKKEDPSGRERSRTERLMGLAGNTLGGLTGSALAMRAAPRSGILAPMIGGMLGATLGEKATSLPFAAARHMRHPEAVPQQAPQQMQPQQYQTEPMMLNRMGLQPRTF